MDGEKELGIWPVIIVAVTVSSAGVIVIEKDGDHSLPFLYASAKYDSCFFRDFFVKLNKLLSIELLRILIHLQIRTDKIHLKIRPLFLPPILLSLQ